ncbi:MAG: gamma-glutamyltransferase [Deltaproteobacteria bacterium]|nr:gamma-glutamyltransferase [Deltaproteobacteria bacterium]
MAADHPLASAAGAEILRRGGNAVDAACATVFALGVVNPQASGLGGGGFAVIYRPGAAPEALDFRETAPAAATRDMYLRDGEPVPTLSQKGALAVAVPGELAGCADLVKRLGKLKLRAVLEPARRLAARGFPAGPHLVRAANDPRAFATAPPDKPEPPPEPGYLALVRPGGKPMVEGQIIRRPELARTLATLQKQGPDAFYRGTIAKKMVAAVAAAGGILTLADLANYKVVARTPVELSYRGRRVLSMPPPSSGGIALCETLGILQAARPELASLGGNSSAYLHLVAEALKHAFADRARHLGDPAFFQVPVAHLLDPAYHAALARRIATTARPSKNLDSYGTAAPLSALAAPPDDHGTSHVSVVDSSGMAVALTTTVNLDFGARFVAGDTGIVLNDQMDDFSAKVGVPNAFGLIGGEANAIAPGKRPLSSMTPTVVLGPGSPDVEFVLGGAGGPTIISGTLQVLLNLTELGMDAEAAVATPRMHAQWQPDLLMLETEHPLDVRSALERRGHVLAPTTAARPLGVVQAIRRFPDGHLEAASDPRKFGAPAGQ